MKSPVDRVASAREAPIAVVAAPADLDALAASRVLRWCEAWLHRVDIGEAHVTHLLVDVGHTRRASASGLAVLDHARVEAGRRHLGIHLVGAGPLIAGSSLQARGLLGRWASYPTLDAAAAALAPAPDRGPAGDAPVDPDAIMLTSAQRYPGPAGVG